MFFFEMNLILSCLIFARVDVIFPNMQFCEKAELSFLHIRVPSETVRSFPDFEKVRPFIFSGDKNETDETLSLTYDIWH